MSKYRIKMECLETGAPVDVALAAGLECDGYALIAIDGNKGLAVVNRMSIEMMSRIIEKEGNIRAAAVLADARVRSWEIMRKYEKEQKPKGAFGRMDK